MSNRKISQNGVFLANCPKTEIFRTIHQYHNISEAEYLKVSLQGKNSQTVNNFFDEISRKLLFPDYFGRNFNALDECLSDLEWLNFKGLCIFIEQPHLFLCQEPEDILRYVIEIFTKSSDEWQQPIQLGESWDRESVPCHFVFVGSSEPLNFLDLPFVEC